MQQIVKEGEKGKAKVEDWNNFKDFLEHPLDPKKPEEFSRFKISQQVLKAVAEIIKEHQQQNNDKSDTQLNLSYKYLCGIDLSGVLLKNHYQLNHAKLVGADLRNTDLVSMSLSDADLSDAHLWNADLSDANLSLCSFNENTDFTSAYYVSGLKYECYSYSIGSDESKINQDKKDLRNALLRSGHKENDLPTFLQSKNLDLEETQANQSKEESK